MIYFLIFIAKIVENTLSTLRLILVANGRKLIGAILQGIVTLIWLFSAATVIINIDDDIYKIVFFVLGATIGSYLGSILEEILAYGNNLLTVTSTKDLLLYLNNCNIKYILINDDINSVTVNISTTRKKRHSVVSLIKSFDKKAIIITQKVLIID